MFNQILLFLMLKKFKKRSDLDYLSKNPDFFIENQDILTQINFPLLQIKIMIVKKLYRLRIDHFKS